MQLLCRILSYSLLLGGSGLLLGGASSPAASAPAPAAQWQLRLLDGHYVAPDNQQLGHQFLSGRSRQIVFPRHPVSSSLVGLCQQSLRTRLTNMAYLASTMLRADDRAVAFELRYLTLLEQVTTYEVRNNQLCLYDTIRPAPRLVFIPAP